MKVPVELNIKLFVSTVRWDIVSWFIRWVTRCAWSHCGFIDLSTMRTYSAMADGKGLTWRPLGKRQEILILNCPRADEMLTEALNWEGQGYDYLAILGMLFGRNWSNARRKFCNFTVFRSAQIIGQRLLNDTFIPAIHFSPDDLLKSQLVSEYKSVAGEGRSE